MAEEGALVKACLKGDQSAQRALYNNYAKAMYAVALRYTQTQAEAEDVLQDSFIKVFEKLQSFKAAATLGSWIKRIVVNTALNYQRSKLYMYPMVDVDTVEQGHADFQSPAGYQFEELLEMVRALPSGCQVIFNLYAIEGYKHKEIAEMLNISEGTSKSQYARARVLLQEMLTDSKGQHYERSQR